MQVACSSRTCRDVCAIWWVGVHHELVDFVNQFVILGAMHRSSTHLTAFP